MSSQLHAAKVLPKENNHRFPFEKGQMGPRTHLDFWKNDGPQSSAQYLMTSL